jgi:hypothetical protein
MLEQGPVESNIIGQSMKHNMPLPEKIQNAPILFPGLELFYTAFDDLISSRQMGMSVGPISWETVQKYCDHLGLGPEQSEAMHYHIRAMDATYLSFLMKKQKK